MGKNLLVFLYVILMTVGVYFGISSNPILLLAVLFGLYMAMNIGANDVANNVSPAVGSGAITLLGALIIAAVFESAGAIIAGGDVIKTVKDGIIDISGFHDVYLYIYSMLAALLSAALWLNLATFFRAPVSTTHSIVGGILGAGIAALGFDIVNWETMRNIIASWFISPVFGAIIAAIFLYGIKHLVIFRDDKIKSAKIWVPFFVALMMWAFTTYLILKGLKHIISVDFSSALSIGFLVGVLSFFLEKMKIDKSKKMENDRKSINKLFNIPLIMSVGFLSFAHGANDVANAVGPLAAIYDAVVNTEISGKVTLPFWILILGGTGLSAGLLVYGPKIIKTVGSEITELDQVRAFCIALSAAITVIIASQLGLPVSSTHIAIGGVFGVGFLREYLDYREHGKKHTHVHRGLVKKIVLAWIITVPVVAMISAGIFLGIYSIAYTA